MSTAEPFRALDPDALPRVTPDDVIHRPACLRPFPALDPIDDELDAAIERLRGELAAEDAAVRRVPKPRRVIDLTVFAVALAVILGVLAGVLGVSVAPAQAASSSLVQRTAGVWLSAGRNAPREWAGRYRDAAGQEGWCISFLLQMPSGAVQPGDVWSYFPSELAAAKALAITARYRSSRDAATAKRVWLALAEELSANPAGMRTADMRARAAKLRAAMPVYRGQETAADRAAIAALRALPYGPFTSRTVLRAAVPGQPGSAVITVSDAAGRPAGR